MLELIATTKIVANTRNSRTHSEKQVRQIATSIKEFGFTSPVLVDENYVLIAGHGRLSAAKILGLPSIPTIVVAGLTDAKKRALMLADNRIAQGAGWDREQLAFELAALGDILIEEGLCIDITGFEPAEIDVLASDLNELKETHETCDLSSLDRPAVTRPGDLWKLNGHRLLCADARNPESLKFLMQGEAASMAFLDVPYNLRVREIVGRGRRRHREFKMASGEMSREEFIQFLRDSLSCAASVSRQSALHYVCIDWRHVDQLIETGRECYSEFLNLIVWTKSNAGQGSFYRSGHELVGLFRVGNQTHQNNIELGRHGRNRSNVWAYAGVNTFRAGRLHELSMHPTVKPTIMVADAIKDCTKRREIVLDTFCGSGTTILAAEKVGRRGYGIEIDPAYVDVAIHRWQALTGTDAIDAETGESFERTAARRSGTPKTFTQVKSGGDK